MQYPPEVERFFAEQRAKQEMHIAIATTNKNLKETAHVLTNMFEKVHQRSAILEECAVQSEELLESSESFHLAVMPGWKRYIYSFKAPWWWCSCCSIKKNKK